jgi:hypothetical protein
VYTPLHVKLRVLGVFLLLPVSHQDLLRLPCQNPRANDHRDTSRPVREGFRSRLIFAEYVAVLETSEEHFVHFSDDILMLI